MLFRKESPGRFVTCLERKWCVDQDIDFALFHTERMTFANIGNKAFKLADIRSNTSGPVLSFGGAWSNHLHALACLCHRYGIRSVGVVRGEASQDNVMLKSMRRYGMHLHFVSRAEYRMRDDVDYCDRLCQSLGCASWLPEGGSDESAVDRCGELATAIHECGFDPTIVVLPVGTGATLAGITRRLGGTCEVIGLPVVRDDKVYGNILRWVGNDCHWHLQPVLSPGYGRASLPLLRFIVEFHRQTRVILDPVYSGKALMHCLKSDFAASLPAGARVLFVHTGGLMGNYGYLHQFREISDAGDAMFAAEFIRDLNQICAVHTADV